MILKADEVPSFRWSTPTAFFWLKQHGTTKKKSGRNVSKTPKKKIALNFWLETQIWHLHTLDLLRQRLDEIIEAVHNPSEGFHLKIHWLMSGWPTGKIWENWFHFHQYCVKALLSCLARNLLHFFLNLKLSANAWPLCAFIQVYTVYKLSSILVMLFTGEYQRWSWIKPATGLISPANKFDTPTFDTSLANPVWRCRIWWLENGLAAFFAKTHVTW